MAINYSNNPNVLLFGVLAGGAVGAIIALLMKLKNGREFRGDIEQKSREFFDEASEYYQEEKIKEGERLNELSSAK